ncbi:MAG: hypothetical protein EBY38_07125, partial [Flavobacteriaceae bacterium]|nr:hypothetical protein [Flavobacteriaceae bacterium]
MIEITLLPESIASKYRIRSILTNPVLLMAESCALQASSKRFFSSSGNLQLKNSDLSKEEKDSKIEELTAQRDLDLQGTKQ